MREIRSVPVTIVAEHLPVDSFRDGLSIAHFTWPDLQPRDTYTVALNDFVSLELDGHLPVRPSSVSLYDEADKASIESLANVFGEEFTRVLKSARFLGVATLGNFSLSDDQRHTIARLQQSSPSTPPILRGLTTVMEKEHSVKPETMPGISLPSIPQTRLFLPFRAKKAA